MTSSEGKVIHIIHIFIRNSVNVLLVKFMLLSTLSTFPFDSCLTGILGLHKNQYLCYNSKAERGTGSLRTVVLESEFFMGETADNGFKHNIVLR